MIIKLLQVKELSRMPSEQSPSVFALGHALGHLRGQFPQFQVQPYRAVQLIVLGDLLAFPKHFFAFGEHTSLVAMSLRRRIKLLLSIALLTKIHLCHTGSTPGLQAFGHLRDYHVHSNSPKPFS